MFWQKTLFERLELDSLVKKRIVLDKYGLSKDERFKDYVEKQGLACYFTDNIDEIVENFGNYSVFFVYNLRESQLPYHIKSKTKVILLDSRLCFCKIDNAVEKGLGKDKLKKILTYTLSEGKFLYINESNAGEILQKAEEIYFKNRVDTLKKELENIFKMDSIEKQHIFKAAELYSNLIWCFFKLKTPPPKKFLTDADEMIRRFILSEGYKDSFLGLCNTINRIVHEIKKKKLDKIALICFDGMGIIEWNVLKEYFNKHDVKVMREGFIFTLIPTATFNCRSSLFSGKVEECYRGIDENKEFIGAFSDVYKTYILKPGKIIGEFFDDKSAVKIVYNFFDDNSHAYVFSNYEESKNIFLENLARQIDVSNIADEIIYLLKQGFKIFISSDHGCVVSKGNGIRVDKYLIEEKCGRGVLAKDSILIDKYKDMATILDLPFVSNLKAIVAKDREAFYTKDKLEITHGGISIEEIIVPLIEVNI